MPVTKEVQQLRHELARTPTDTPAGLLRLALGDGRAPLSAWKRITDYVERQLLTR